MMASRLDQFEPTRYTICNMRLTPLIGGLLLILTGCAGVSYDISRGQYSYGAKDVEINHFGFNYSISIPLNVRDQRLTAQTLASDCETGSGSLKIFSTKTKEDHMYSVSVNGKSSQDDIFKYLCERNPKLVRAVRGCS